MVKCGWVNLWKDGGPGNAGGGERGGGIHNTCWMAGAENKFVGCNWTHPLVAFSYHPITFSHHMVEMLDFRDSACCYLDWVCDD